MRILITGGAGFIGSHIAEFYRGKAEVRVLDNLRSGFRRNLLGMDHVQFIKGDVRNRNVVREALVGVDYVFHLAAMVSVPESMNNAIECVDINVNGTLIVLEEAARAGVKKLCFSSSAAVYGDGPEQPKRESACPDPQSPHAITLLDGEYYCREYQRAGRLNTVCLRYFNVFGPRQNPDSDYSAVVARFVHNAIHGEKLTIFGDGTQSRDFIYVEDVAAANAFFAENDCTGCFNVASGEWITINELADKICFITDSQSEIEHIPARPGDVKRLTASNDKLRGVGFRCSHSFMAGLSSTIAAFKA